ncbi:AAA family ATPase [Kordiimonas lipolytica]|uniref:AAA family ATPase n=1 Tax=Kordiimonas lipolytica TaxID=1662421 RepID=A0ABV8UED6_9PROT|nr:ATP-binding protein [Kordiimonas lipolytica]
MFGSAYAEENNVTAPSLADEILLAALEGDTVKLRKAASEIAKLYEGTQKSKIAVQIHDLLNRSPIELRPLRDPQKLPVDLKSRFPLLQKEDWPSDPLILPDSLAGELEIVLQEIGYASQLAKEGLGARNAILLHGMPGTGKSLIAGHIAMRLGRPLLTIRLDTIISSLLGDTAKNIRSLFEYALAGGAVLFLDEIDAVAKKRDDNKELGELKRVVNALLQGLDLLDHEAVVIAATNHPHMLDPAIWRRFPYQYEIAAPDSEMRQELWKHYLFQDIDHDHVAAIAKISDGLTGSDIREISIAARRRAIVTQSEIQIMGIVRSILDSSPSEICRPNFQALSGDIAAKYYWILYDKHKLTQLQIAKLAGVSKQSVSKLLKSYKNTK